MDTSTIPIEPTVDKNSAAVQAMFDQIAGRYDLLNHLLSANQDRRWRHRAIHLLSPRAGERILDLCCGTGDLGFECLRQQPACEVIGSDFSLPMLRLAQRKSNAGQNYLAADALRLPFADASFDSVMVGFGARNFEDTRQGLSEMRRVVKPGGKLLILEFMRPESVLIERGFGLFFQHALPFVGRVVSKHRAAYYYLPASVRGFYNRSEFAGLLRSVGTNNVRSFQHSGGIATTFLAQRRDLPRVGTPLAESHRGTN